MPAATGIAEKKKKTLLFVFISKYDRFISHRHESTPVNYTTRFTHPLTNPSAHEPNSSTAVKLVWGVFYIEYYVYKNKITGPSPTGTETHPRTIPHVLPTHVHPHHPPTTHRPSHYNKCCSMYGSIPVREENLVGSRVLRTRSLVKKHGGGRFFTNPRHLGERTSRYPPSAHPPRPTHRPTNHSSTAVRTDQSTTAAQQCNSSSVQQYAQHEYI